MLRFHKFTVGLAWASDFGNPDDEDDFKVLLKFVPKPISLLSPSKHSSPVDILRTTTCVRMGNIHPFY